MSRSPLAYPLNRGIDADSGGAADLQTDIMRFMAILSLCLVAIFALVQSIPLAPTAPARLPAPSSPPQAEVRAPEPEAKSALRAPARALEPPSTVTRPEQAVQKTPPAPAEAVMRPASIPRPAPLDRATAPAATETADPRGFSLRFESDLALTRLVAAGQVGFFAISPGRAQRMAVGESRINFWDASTPNSFHEMDAATVPAPVIEALARTGVDAGSVDWGVTLPGRLRAQLAALMREHSGGALVIGADGSLALEET